MLMKRMSQIICRVMILTLIVALLCPLMSGAGAAAPGIPAKVWLNGKPVTFDDAYPRNEDGRVFLPFRAIFEALGSCKFHRLVFCSLNSRAIAT